MPHANILEDKCVGLDVVVLPIAWPCYECGASLKSRQALAAHSFRKHGSRKAGRFYVESDAICHGCLLMFPTRRRCIEHIDEKSSLCLKFLVDSFTPLPTDVVAVLDEADRVGERLAKRCGKSRAQGHGSCVRVHGPSRMHDGHRHPVSPNRRYIAANN